MLRTYLYLPVELNQEITSLAKTQKKSKAEVIRVALSEGIKVAKKKNSGADVLLKIAALGQKYNVSGPKDSSINHDHYLWDRDWSKDE